MGLPPNLPALFMIGNASNSFMGVEGLWPTGNP